MMRRAFGAIVVAAAAACQSTVYDAVDPVVRVATPLVWAGSDIVLTSAGFAGADTLPLVLLGDDTLAARYAAPDSVHVVAPAHQGTFDLRVGFRGRSPLPVGAITVEGGYAGFTIVGQIGGYPLLWPGGGRPTFLIAVPTGLAMVDPRSGTTVQLLSDTLFSQDCYNGPGPAPDGRVAVAGRVPGGGCGPLVSVRPDAPTPPQDTGPACGGCRFGAQLGPGRWLEFYHHGFESWSRDATGVWTHTIFLYGEPYDVAISPRGDRAIPIGATSSPLGTPVFTPTSAAPAYVLPQFPDVWAAQFSDAGDTLYLASDTTDSTAHPPVVLAALRASDGTVLRSAPGWSETESLVLDPGRPWLYLVGYESSGKPAVQVVDRVSLAPVVTLAVPADAWPSEPPGVLYPMLSAVQRKLYLLDTCPWCTAGAGNATRIIVFDLLR